MAAVTAHNPADIAAVEDVLKEVWVSDTLRSQLYEDMILFDWVEEVREYTDSDGLKASVPLKTGRTGGVGSRGIGQKLPYADHQKVAKAEYNYKFHYLQIKLEAPVIARMSTDRQAAVRHVDFEVSNGIDDLKHMLCRQLHSDGTARLLTNVLGSTASGATKTVTGVDKALLQKGWIYEGLVLSCGTQANPTLDHAGARVVGVDDEAGTITFHEAFATTAGSNFFVQGNAGAGSVSYEMNGLAGIVSPTLSLGGLSPASNSFWKPAAVLSNGGTERALTIELLLTALRKVRQRGDYPDIALTDLEQESAYYLLLADQVQFQGDRDLTAGNSEGLAFARMKIVGDPEAAPGKIRFLKKNALQMYSAGEIGWQNTTTGGNILAWAQDYDAFVARAAKYCEIGTDRRRSFAEITDLQTDLT